MLVFEYDKLSKFFDKFFLGGGLLLRSPTCLSFMVSYSGLRKGPSLGQKTSLSTYCRCDSV